MKAILIYKANRQLSAVKLTTWFSKMSLCVSLFLCTSLFAAGAPDLSSGLPPKTALTKLGDEIYLNGMLTDIIGIAVPASIKDTAVFFAQKWATEGWKVTVERTNETVYVMSVNGVYQRVASLNKTGDSTTEGSLSLTDMPLRLKNGGGTLLPVGEHLLKPLNTAVLNEVLVRDQLGESIMTTMINSFNVEQNTAFYQERMVEIGWKESRRKTVEEGKSVILVFTQARKEATFTLLRRDQQTLITVLWLNK
jgi:hypothetical protein